MMKKRTALFCVISLIVLLLGGCGGGEDSLVLNDSVESYTVSKVTFTMDSLLQLPYLFRVEDTLLGIGFLSDGTWQFYFCGTEEMLKAAGGSLAMSVPEQDVFGDRFVRLAFPDKKKFFYTVEQEQTTEELLFYLCSYDLNGSRLWETDITSSVEGEIYLFAGAADGDGMLYLSRGGEANSILVFDTGGVMQEEIEMDDQSVRELAVADGKVWCVAQDQKNGTVIDILYWVDLEKKALQEELELPEGRGNTSLSRAVGETLFYSDYEGVKEYAPKERVVTKLYTWLDAGITGREVNALFAVSEKSIGVFTDQGSSREVLLLRADSETVAMKADAEAADMETNGAADMEIEKIEIVLDGSPEDSYLQQAVSSFNVQSEKYQVVIRDYPNEGGRLEAELVSGEGPDLLSVDSIDISVYVEKGLLEDLTDYLDKSDILSSDQLNQRIQELYTIDDKLICIPATFGITTVMGRASELGTESGWTLEEFHAYVDSYPGATVYEGLSLGETREYLVWTSLWASWDKVIDFEERRAYFDSGYFVELLEYAANYDARYDSEVHGDRAERLKEGKLLLLNDIILNSSDYHRYKTLLNGDMVCIGWPTEEGIPRHGIIGFGAYAISTTSENKEGAWEFIEYLISSQTRGDTQRFHTYCEAFPTLNAGFEDLLEYESIYIADPAPTDEDQADIRQLTENVSYRLETTSVDSIIYEELEACFSGARSVEETARIIQNRVQLYLDEM